VAVRISANGQHYTKAFGLADACTVSCWVKATVDRAAKSGFFALASATTNFFMGLGTGGGWNFEQTVGGSVQQAPGGFTIGAWHRIGLIHSTASTVIVYYGAATGALTALTMTGAAWSASTSIKIGCEPTTTNWLNGCVANFKAWDASLTVAELTAEFLVVRPQRVANLAHDHQFIGADVTDYSGQNRNLGGGVGATSEVGPPIPLYRLRRYMAVPPGLPAIGKRRYKQQATQRSYNY
jgi:hypothetical protein